MMDRSARRAASADFRKRESVPGVFALRDTTDGAVWVGHTPNVEAIGNRLTFALKTGGHANAALQKAWAAHGEAAFVLETLELLDPKELGYVGDKALRERASQWRERLGAAAV